MSINKKLLFTVAAAGMVLGVSSCRKYLDVNTNPNIAQTATVQTMLPAGQLYIASALGVDMQVAGSMWTGYWTQSPNSSQYRTLEQYNPGQDMFSTVWENLYTANENFYQMGKLADSLKRRHYKALSLMMQAYTFQLITDGFGDAPFRQALKGQPEDGGLLNPKYDSQRVIYSGAMAYIDSAESLLSFSDANGPGSDDLLFQGNVTRWKKFGYTLKLRMLMRLSAKDPIAAQTGIAALYATPGVQFLTTGDDARIKFGASTTNKNPLYAEASSTALGSAQNLVASSTCVDSMNANNDERVSIFYTTVNSALGTQAVVGIAQGSSNLSGNEFSLPSAYVAGDAQDPASAMAPVNFMSVAESKFLQAEAVARGWAVTATSDSAYFSQGIEASFNSYNDEISATLGHSGATAFSNYMTSGGYWTMYPVGGTVTDKVRFIITQKWFAMCGNQGFEAWSEMRRTGYPDFFVRSAVGGAADPKRFKYPTSESTRNNAFPGVAPVGAKVWWDIL